MSENKEYLECALAVIQVFIDIGLLNGESTVKELIAVIDGAWSTADANQKVVKN